MSTRKRQRGKPSQKRNRKKQKGGGNPFQDSGYHGYVKLKETIELLCITTPVKYGLYEPIQLIWLKLYFRKMLSPLTRTSVFSHTRSEVKHLAVSEQHFSKRAEVLVYD